VTYSEIDAYNTRAEAEGLAPIRVMPIFDDAEPDRQEP
jgi:hypothetical protein